MKFPTGQFSLRSFLIKKNISLSTQVHREDISIDLAILFAEGEFLIKLKEDMGQYDKETPIFGLLVPVFVLERKILQKWVDSIMFLLHTWKRLTLWRLNARGRKVMCIPSSVVYHVGGASLSKDNPKKCISISVTTY